MKKVWYKTNLFLYGIDLLIYGVFLIVIGFIARFVNMFDNDVCDKIGVKLVLLAAGVIKRVCDTIYSIAYYKEKQGLDVEYYNSKAGDLEETYKTMLEIGNELKDE